MGTRVSAASHGGMAAMHMIDGRRMVVQDQVSALGVILVAIVGMMIARRRGGVQASTISTGRGMTSGSVLGGIALRILES